MDITHLFPNYPQNIRRRLLRDIIGVLLLTTLLIIATSAYLGLTMRRDISSTIITDTTTIVKKRFRQFTDPIETTLQIGRQWGEAGMFASLDEQGMMRLLVPVLQAYPHISAVMLADSNGGEFFLHREKDSWKSRRFTSLNEGGGTAQWRQWRDTSKADKSWQEHLQYDPRSRPWFAEAVAGRDEIFWTEPYMFFTAGKIGVTAAISWSSQDGVDQVLALDLLQEDLLNFLNSLGVGKNGHIILIERDGSIIVHNQATQLRQSSGPVTRAMELWQADERGEKQALEFSSAGQSWWAGFSPLDGADASSWVVVIVPEKEIMADVKQRWLQWGLVALLVIGGGVVFAYRLVAKYSYQLRDLPRQNISNQNLENELRSLIEAGESASLEFKSTMRTNLKTGKKGKEIELAWLKAVVAFMNSDGGILLIGVEDDGTIMGIGADNFANEDKVRLHFKSLISHHIGPEFVRFIQLKICLLEGKMLLIIECERVRRPVFLVVGKNEDFLVRSGPSSMKMSMSQMIKYIEGRI